ncbi:hypothetical protein NEFER03_1300 [Nematocida sp. LUAm3]|nr:hypothetical protein NEFER03_1300 [Nematocida sp. LUAm3]KAI5174078.1 hypothetical protein NEFER02_0545 [Nematocida sp. LUAm2]KAI5177179.1 hypothetical protein NEFER01_0454 [Nematocida sp. LUAm1]
MEYFSIKDAIVEGIFLKVRLNVDLQKKDLQEVLKGRIKENEVILPYYMAECLLSTGYIEIIEVIEKKELLEMEGSLEYYDLQGKMFFPFIEKMCKEKIINEEEKKIVKKMHHRRAIKGSKMLSEEGVKYLDREEERILWKARGAWRR